MATVYLQGLFMPEALEAAADGATCKAFDSKEMLI